ncbi:MAG: DNA cytosine methyltransferase [Flavobacteriaceae bacterium]|nr:DNA cytosine methyltransferase [Flavobacteriaceae bacterium]
MKAIDLYSGIGGWTLGFKMAGIEVVASYEWWKDANYTHNKNFGTDHTEKNIRELDLVKDLPNPDEIDFVVGSPPCTQFSFANRGGNGDIADGIIDVYKFLEVVDYIKPKYWAMENVPRVAGILEREILKGGSLDRFSHLFDSQFRVIKTYNSADYGVPQSRKRMIAGCFPFELFDSYQEVTPSRTLRDVVEGLMNNPLKDPVYGHEIENLTDNIGESPLSWEEERINKDSKTHHPVYNRMSFPDSLDRPSRTVTALCTRVSRESIIIETEPKHYRRLTVRERGCIQTFPSDYQYYSNSYGGKLKMIGNAVPPLLTYYIANSMLETPISELKEARSKGEIVNNFKNLPRIIKPENKGSNFTWSRSFWLAIPYLRLGSGVRFELRNKANKEIEKVFWRVNFFYGNSKSIKELSLDKELFLELWEALEIIEIAGLVSVVESTISYVQKLDIEDLQENWTNRDRTKTSPISVVDRLGEFARIILNLMEQSPKSNIRHLKSIIDHGFFEANKKLIENSNVIVTGLLIGSIFNTIIKGEELSLEPLLQSLEK